MKLNSSRIPVETTLKESFCCSSVRFYRSFSSVFLWRPAAWGLYEVEPEQRRPSWICRCMGSVLVCTVFGWAASGISDRLVDTRVHMWIGKYSLLCKVINLHRVEAGLIMWECCGIHLISCLPMFCFRWLA